jgi:hypothetical protein
MLEISGFFRSLLGVTGRSVQNCWDFLPADKQIFGEQGALKVPGHGAHFIAVIKPRHDLRREVVSPA